MIDTVGLNTVIATTIVATLMRTASAEKPNGSNNNIVDPMTKNDATDSLVAVCFHVTGLALDAMPSTRSESSSSKMVAAAEWIRSKYRSHIASLASTMYVEKPMHVMVAPCSMMDDGSKLIESMNSKMKPATITKMPETVNIAARIVAGMGMLPGWNGRF